VAHFRCPTGRRGDSSNPKLYRTLAMSIHCTYVEVVSELRFDWDPRKAAANLRKHGVSFVEAKTVFWDDFALFEDDPDHSESEPRFLLLGLSSTPRLLLVVHCFEESDETITIISARKATPSERAKYSQRWCP
jgi:uncharacterized DUF497 family protein